MKILPPCVFCKITSKVFMLGHGKKTTNIAKALWLAMAIKTSLWLQILISEKKYLTHSFCYIDLFPGKWACKDDNDHSNMPGRVAMTGDLFLSSIVDWFSHSMPTIHIILIPSSFSTSWERRHQSQSIEIQTWRNISYLFWIIDANRFVDLAKKQKAAFHPSPIVCRGHIITAVKQLLNNL